jgi:hypothetical protein
MPSPRRRLVPLFLALLAIPRFASAAGSEADSSYRSYRIPDHRWSQSIADLSGAMSHRDQSTPFGSQSRSGLLRGNVRARASWGYDSEASSLAWDLSAEASGDRAHDETRVADAFQQASGDNSGKSLDESFFASASWRRYPWSAPVGLTLSTFHRYSLSQRFSSGEGTRVLSGQTERTLASSALGSWNYQGTLGAGVGLGRVRDATPVYQAQVLEDRLRRTGALDRPLSSGARHRLAALLATRAGVAYAHERPDKYFWEALEQVLREDGALERGSLDAYSAHRVLEPVTPKGFATRRIGWFVGPAVVVTTARAHWSDEQASSFTILVGGMPTFTSEFRSDSERHDRQDLVSTALVAELHRPLGLRWQAGASHTTQVGESGSFVAASTLLSASYLVSDRWVGSVSASHSALARGWGSARRVETWAVQVSAGLSYFLEDSWALSLSASEAQRHGPSFYRSGGLSFGITRLFSGAFELPGITAMRLSPPGP